MLDTAIVLGQAAESDGAHEVVAQFSTGEEYGAIYQKGSPNASAFDGIISDVGRGRHAAMRSPRSGSRRCSGATPTTSPTSLRSDITESGSAARSAV